MNRTQLAGLAVAAVLLALPAAARAQIWTEVGDAGGIALTAQNITTTPGFNQINGTYASATDMDVYQFFITTPSTFSATTQGGNTPGGLDTMLFLFTGGLAGGGVGIAGNDDITGSVNSTLPAGDALYASLLPGFYILATSTYQIRPTSAQGIIFVAANPPNGVDGLGVGPPQNNGVFDGQNNVGGAAGAYSIFLTSVAPVPEPGTFALCAAAALSGWLLKRRRQRNVSVTA